MTPCHSLTNPFAMTSVGGVAVGGGRDVSSGDDSGGEDYSGDQLDPYEVVT